MPILFSSVIFTALFSIILFSPMQKISAQEKWIEFDNSNESSETIKTLSIEEILALDTQELQAFVEKQSTSHIESYVKMIRGEFKNKTNTKEYLIWLKPIYKLLRDRKEVLKDKISDQKIAEWLKKWKKIDKTIKRIDEYNEKLLKTIKRIDENNKEWLEEWKKINKTIKQLKGIKKQLNIKE